MDEPTRISAVAFDFVGVLARTRMAFDGPSPYVLVLDEQVVDVVNAARASGLKVGLITNNDRRSLLDSELGSTLTSMFDSMVFASDVSNPKPHPEIFKYLLDEMGVEPKQCALVDDSPRNCEIAEMLGMQTLVATSQSQIRDFVASLQTT